MHNTELHHVVQLIKSGDKATALNILNKLVKQEPNNENLWYLMAICVGSEEEKKKYLIKVLEINPDHSKAKSAIARLIPTTQNIPPNKANHRTPSLNLSLNFLVILLSLCLLWLVFRVNSLDKKLSLAQSDLKRLNKDIAVTQIDVSTLDMNLTATRVDVSNLNLEISDVQSALIILDGDVSTAFSAIRTLASGLDYVTPLAENANRYAHEHTYFSDIRLKTDVQEISDPLARVLTLHGIQFYWNENASTELELSNRPQVGFIAQEVELVFPELVIIDPQTGYKTIDYAKLTPILVEAVREQQTRIEELEQEVEALQKK